MFQFALKKSEKFSKNQDIIKLHRNYEKFSNVYRNSEKLREEFQGNFHKLHRNCTHSQCKLHCIICAT